MKILFIGMFLFVFSANAQEEILKKPKSESAIHICYTKDGKKQTLESSNLFNTKKACESAGMFRSLSDIENTGNCKAFADMFLNKRGLGKISHPSLKLRQATFNNDQLSGLPEMTLKTEDDDTVSSKANVNKDRTRWTLKIESNWQAPKLESPLATNFNEHKGSYERTYNFEVIGGVCVLQSIDTSFLPDGKSESARKSETISKSDCATFARYYTNAEERIDSGKNAKLSIRESMNGFVCSEALQYFNEPKLNSKGQKNNNYEDFIPKDLPKDLK